MTRFDFTLHYRPGKESGKPDAFSIRSDYMNEENNENEDTTSRLTIKEIKETLCAIAIQGQFKNDFITACIKDEEIQNLIKMLNGSVEIEKSYKKLIKDFKQDNEEKDLLLYKGLLYVPKEMRTSIIEMFHDSPVSGHFGINKTKELITRNFVWLNMTEDISQYIKSCEVCCQAKDDRHRPY